MAVLADELENMFDSIMRYKRRKLIIHELDLALPQILEAGHIVTNVDMITISYALMNLPNISPSTPTTCLQSTNKRIYVYYIYKCD